MVYSFSSLSCKVLSELIYINIFIHNIGTFFWSFISFAHSINMNFFNMSLHYIQIFAGAVELAAWTSHKTPLSFFNILNKAILRWKWICLAGVSRYSWLQHDIIILAHVRDKPASSCKSLITYTTSAFNKGWYFAVDVIT
jgi:hypothetical protein